MISKEEIKRNLLGALEVALFMPDARKRFGSSNEEALRSFFVPVILFPLNMLVFYFSTYLSMEEQSPNIVAFMFSMRLVVVWVIFFGFISYKPFISASFSKIGLSYISIFDNP